MNFVSQVEEYLRDLGSQTRHSIQSRHSSSSTGNQLGGYLAILKEASERGLLTLRSLQNSYVAQIRKSSQNGFDSNIEQQPTTQLFQSEDLLRPFLLACNYAEAPENLIQISLGAIQLLLGAQAVIQADVVQIIRVLSIQASNVHIKEGISLKMLQICSMAVNYKVQGGTMSNHESKSISNIGAKGKSMMHILDEELVMLSFLLCFKMAQIRSNKKNSSSVVSNMSSTMWSAASSTMSVSSSRSSSTSNIGFQNSVTSIKTIRRASNATLRQLVSILFDSISSTIDLLPNDFINQTEENVENLLDYIVLQATVGYKVFMDLCVLADSNSNSSMTVGSSRGPIQQILHQHMILQPPPRSMCFELIDGILTQNKKLFSSNSTFLGLLKLNFCPLVTTTLLSQYSSLMPSDSGEGNSSIHDNSETSYSIMIQGKALKKTTVEDFSLLIRTIHVSKTIVRTYAAFAEFECYILLNALLRFLTTFSEAYQSIPDNEDAFVYKSAHNEQSKSEQKLSKVPSILMWPAALTLEVLYSFVSDSTLLRHINVSFDDDRPMATAISSVSEVLGDFIVASTSTRYTILEFVSFVEDTSSRSVEYSPRFFIDAKEFTKSYDEWDNAVRKTSQNSNTSEGSSGYSPTGSADVSSLVTIPPCSEIDIIFATFQCVISLLFSLDEVSSTLSTDSDYHRLKLLVNCVASSELSSLRHLLNRFHECETIIMRTLNSLVAFSNALLSLDSHETEYRYALFALLCNAADLADEGSQDYRLLSDYNVEIISAVFQIIQNNFEKLSVDEWRYILEVITKLALFIVPSPKMSKNGLRIANSITAGLSRLPAFSSAFSSRALKSILQAIFILSKSESNGNVANNKKQIESFLEHKSEDRSTIHGIGNRLLGFAGRAMHGLTNGASSESSALHLQHSKRYGDDLYLETLTLLEQMIAFPDRPEMEQMTFIICMITGICLANARRSVVFWNDASTYIYDLGEASENNSIRSFCISSLTCLIITNLSDVESNQPSLVRARTAPSNCDQISYFEVDIYSFDEGEKVDDCQLLTQVDILAPLCKILSETKYPSFAEMSLIAFQSILENTGHKLEGDVWHIILITLSSLSGSADRSSIAWEHCCTKAFDCLQLIVKDFIDRIPVTEQARLILLDCCASFCHSKHDVNASFTATGLLWTLADQDPSPKSVEYVSSKLLNISSDERPEVRNASVNTLVSLVVGLGNEFTSVQWQHLCQNLIQTMRCNITEIGVQNSLKFLHQSRKTQDKQWETTLVLLLRGLERILRQFFHNILHLSNECIEAKSANNGSHEYWLLPVWEEITNVALESSVGEDASLAVIDLLVLCSQVTSRAGIKVVTDHVRVGTNMQVVDGALRSVRESNTKESETNYFSTPLLEELQRSLFLVAIGKLLNFVESIQIYARLSLDKDNDSASNDLLYVSEDFIVQLSNRISVGMVGIYKCCRNNELNPGDNANNIEKRFLDALNILLRVVLNQPPSRFLNQGQRNTLELLGIMIKNSSYGALRLLTNYSKTALIENKSECLDDIRIVIAKEAEKEIESFFLCNDMPSNAVFESMQIVIEEELLAIFNCREISNRQVSPAVISMIKGGLNAAYLAGVADEVWETVMKIVPCVFHTIFSEGSAEKLLSLLPSLITNTPERWKREVIDLISKTLQKYTKGLYIEKTQINGNFANTKEMKQVMEALFSALIQLSPLHDEISKMSHYCISHISLLDEKAPNEELGTSMTIFICDELCKHTPVTGPIIMDLFPVFSELIASSDTRLRSAVGKIFKSFEFRKEYEIQKQRAEIAESRASYAEERVLELQANVNNLIDRSNKLQEEVLALGGASPACF